VAFSLVLVVAAGLPSRTFAALAGWDLGFDRDRVLIVGLDANPGRVAPARRAALFERVRQSVAALPGISGAATSVAAPLGGLAWVTGLPGGSGALMNLVGPGWFATYGTRIVAGREFDGGDIEGAPSVAIVNEAFARQFLPGENPIGQTLRLPHGSVQIVGLAADAAYTSVREPVPPTLYTPIAQSGNAPPVIVLSVRADHGSPAALTRSVASAIGAVEAGLAITFRPLQGLVDAMLVNERLLAALSSFFGGLALLLAALGLFGVTSYGVSQHRTEIAVRVALGALPVRVLRLVLGRVALTVGIGIVLGVAASLAGMQILRSLLFGLQPGDPLTLVAAALVLAAVAALATWLPARRAVRLDPAEVLRVG
jgi:putative ABC transport system permease protein